MSFRKFSSQTGAEYVYIRNTATQSLSTASNQVIAFNNASGNMTLSGNSLTLKSGITYRLEGSSGSGNTNSRVVFQWRDTTNNVFIGSSGSRFSMADGAGNTQDTTNAIAMVTPSTNITVQLWVVSSSSAITIGIGANVDNSPNFVWATCHSISGTQAISGSTVDYVQAKLSSQTTVTGVSDIVFNQLVSGNIPLNTSTGVFTLTAEKTYRLEANVHDLNTIGGVNDLFFSWVDATTNNPIVSGLNGSGGILTSGAFTRNYNSNSTVIYTPSTNQTVKLRITGFSITSTNLSTATNASITQLGSSAVGTTAVNDQVSTGYFDIGAMRMQWGSATNTIDGEETFNFTASFGATPQVFTQRQGANSQFVLPVVNVTNSSFGINRDDSINGLEAFSWFAIGAKP